MQTVDALCETRNETCRRPAGRSGALQVLGTHAFMALLLIGTALTPSLAADGEKSGVTADVRLPMMLAQAQSPSAQGPYLVVINRFENRTGAPIDLLRVANGRYEFITTIPPDMVYNYQTRFAETLAFGYGGQQILATHEIVGNYGEVVPISLGPDLLARAGIRPPPQQQRQPGSLALPPGPTTQNRSSPSQIARPLPAQPQSGTLLPPGLPQGPESLPPGGSAAPAQARPDLSAPMPTPSAPPPVTAEEVIPKQNPQLAALPERRSFRNQPWQESPNNSRMFWPAASDGTALTIDQHGDFRYVSINDAQSGATWFFEEVEGTDAVVIRNVAAPDRALYLPEGAEDGTEVAFSERGLTDPGGRWIVEEDGSFSIFRSARNTEMKLTSRNARLSVTTDEHSPEARTAWLGASVRDIRELMGLVQENVDGFVQMAENIDAAEREIREAERRRLEAQEEARLAEARRPWLSGGGQGQSHLTMRLGVDTVEEPVEDRVHSLRYYFDTTPWPYMRAGPFQTSTVDQQEVELQIRPAVYAWAENGQLYVRVRTLDGTALRMLKNNRTPSITDTLNTYYLGNVNIGIWATGGSAQRLSPSNENTLTDAGFSQDETAGVDLNTDSLGGNYSETRGTNANFQSYDYRISSTTDRGGAIYNWQGCGLSVQVQDNDNCTYSGPEDMWLADRNTVRNLKDISLTMPLLLTDTVFVVDPSSVYWADRDHREYGIVTVMMDVGFNLHALDVVQVRQTDATPAQSGWEEFKGGFEFVWRPDKWDFNKSLEDQEVVRSHTMKAMPFGRPGGFDINLRLDVSQLRPYLDGT